MNPKRLEITVALCPLAMFLSFTALSPQAFGATIIVTNTADSGGGTLRAALASAGNGDTIDATGVSGAIQLTSGELSVVASVTILGPGPAVLAVSASSTNRVFHLTPGLNTTIAGLTIGGGDVTGSSFPANAGGGIFNDHGTLLVINCAVGPNTATYGGAIYNDGETTGNANLTVVNSTLNNDESTHSGGAIYNDGEFKGLASLMITNCTLNSDTTPAGFYGGAIYNDAHEGSATVTISASSLVDNNATQGGAIENYADDGGSGTVTVSACTLNENSALYGGAIYNDGDGVGGSALLTVINSTFAFNNAGHGGGAIYNYGDQGQAMLTVNNCTFSTNSANGNLGTFNGGGCIFNNSAQTGSATARIGDSILQNADESAANLVNLVETNSTATITSTGYNLSSDNSSGFLTGTGDQINTDPMLAPLANNGGPTLTLALLPGSPAIDAGDPGFTPPPYFDQRGPGFPRVVNGRIDIGAFEFAPGPGLPVLTIQPATNGFILAWPASTNGFYLQQNSNLTTVNWVSNTIPVYVVNGSNQVTVPPGSGNLFFRLIR